MFEHIFNILTPEFIILGIPLFGMLLLLAVVRQDICFALGYPAYIFFAQLKHFFAVSNSAGAALFPLAAGLIAFMKTLRFRFGLCEKLMFALAVVMVISLSYSPTPTYGRDKAALFCFMVIPIIALAPNIITNTKQLRTVIAIVVATSNIFVFTSLIMRMQFGHIEGRSAGLFDETRAGQFLGLAVLLSLAYVIYKKDVIHKVFFFGIFLISGFLTFMTGTRAAVLAFVLSLFFMYWFLHRDWFRRLFTKAHITIATVFLCLFFLLFGGYFLKSFLPSSVYARFASVENFFSNFTSIQVEHWRKSHTRALNYMSAIKSFAENPLTGAGAGGYKVALATYGSKLYAGSGTDDLTHVYPHNVILEFTCEQGILGLILFLWVLYLNLRMILRLRKIYGVDPRNGFLMLICVLIYFYGLCVAMTALDIPRMMILWWGMGLLIAADKLYRGQLYLSSKSLTPANQRGLNGGAVMMQRRFRT